MTFYVLCVINYEYLEVIILNGSIIVGWVRLLVTITGSYITLSRESSTIIGQSMCISALHIIDILPCGKGQKLCNLGHG